MVPPENSATPALLRQAQHGRASYSSSWSSQEFSSAPSASFSSAPAFQLSPNRWLVPPRPSARFWQCVGQTRAGPDPCCPIMASWRTEYTQPPQLPPRRAPSGFRRCFHSAAWCPAHSSFRLKARLLRRFHRAGQQPTLRGAASGAQLPPPRGAWLNGAQPSHSFPGLRQSAATPRQPAPRLCDRTYPATDVATVIRAAAAQRTTETSETTETQAK